MVANTVYEPRLVEAFSLLRPHPAWAAPVFNGQEGISLPQDWLCWPD